MRIAVFPRFSGRNWLWVAGALALASPSLLAQTEDPLPAYVSREDREFKWRRIDSRQIQEFRVTRLQCVSQKWREHTWRHDILVVRPPEVRNPDVALLLISGSSKVDRSLGLLQKLAAASGAITAVINQVPNQPLYGGRSEDALIAYTFEQYLNTGDSTWPLLFPMVKSAVRGMDAVEAHVRKDYKQNLERFVTTGASKRGWTTWLTAVVDPRVKAIAPMVIDMLNMKAQTRWAALMYGSQSEQIRDYTEYNFTERMNEPEVVKLMNWVDPYSYRSRYRLPKLLLLGTNDPYWVVDSLRHYWSELPEPKLVYQAPNTAHDIGSSPEAHLALTAFFQMIADREELPTIKWSFTPAQNRTNAAVLEVEVRPPTKQFTLWTANSSDRDFRDETWTSATLSTETGDKAEARVQRPTQGFTAYLVQADMVSSRGLPYKLSTEARVTPDGRPRRTHRPHSK